MGDCAINFFVLKNENLLLEIPNSIGISMGYYILIYQHVIYEVFRDYLTLPEYISCFA